MTAQGTGGPRRQASVNVSPEERIADLERRMADMEVVPRLRARGRSMLEMVMPPEAAKHFRSGARENLTGMRTIVDHWIRKMDESDQPSASGPERETIEIR